MFEPFLEAGAEERRKFLSGAPEVRMEIQRL